jgi:hypothetical protein
MEKRHPSVQLNHATIPIRWAFILLSASGSGLILAMAVGIWSAKIETRLQAAETRIEKRDSSSQDSDKTLVSIDERLSRIEGSLGIHKH